MSKVLVIDDEQTIIENLKFVLELEDFEVMSSVSAIEGLKLFKENKDDIDVVITDMRMPRISGIEIISEVKKLMPEMCVIVLTGHGDMENAIQAMKEGAFEYLKKPINADELMISIVKARNKKNLTLENARMHSELMEQNIYLKNLTEASEKILLKLMPGDLPNNKYCNFAAKFRSSDEVGGDMYDSFDIGDYICSYVFDVSSHGILAAVIAVLLKGFFENMRYNFLHNKDFEVNFPKIISELNIEFLENSAQYTFASLYISFLEKSTKKLYYVSAGHPTQFMFNKTGDIIPMKSTGTLLGAFKEATYKLAELNLKKGDKILMYTDGVTEVAKDNILYGENGIINFIKKNNKKNIKETVNLLMDDITSYSSYQFHDDITILGIEVL
jgi:sigma-B regulation protein RsbU (phosphoserine phosphatase)